MTAKIIDGKAVAEEIRARIKTRVDALREKTGKAPGLGVILVGEDPASQVYVRMKCRACDEVGFNHPMHTPAAGIAQEALLALVDGFNADPDIDGILVQLPLPDHIDEEQVLCRIDPAKDADGFHPYNVGLLHIGKPQVVACTPKGVLELVKRTGVPIKGATVTVVGRSNIVGKPVAALLMAEHGTVTICHSRTRDLPDVCRRADILVAAIGRPEMIRGDWIKPGAVVIDVGTNRVEEPGRDKPRLVGDVCFAEAKEIAGHITPVPGGVGPMTIAMLLQNTLEAFERRLDGGPRPAEKRR